MKRLLLVLALGAVVPSTTEAATVVATCTDGQKISYRQTVSGKGTLFLKGVGGTLNAWVGVAPLQQTDIKYQSPNVVGLICSVAIGNSVDGKPVTRICADAVNNRITLSYRNPTIPGAVSQDAGVLCPANVFVQ